MGAQDHMIPDLTSTLSIHGTTRPLYQHSLHGMATETIYCQSFHNLLFTTQPLSHLLALCPGILCSLDSSSTPLPPQSTPNWVERGGEAAGLPRETSLSGPQWSLTG